MHIIAALNASPYFIFANPVWQIVAGFVHLSMPSQSVHVSDSHVT